MSATSTVPTATPTAQTFEIRPFPGSVGAEIVGLDLSRPVNDQDFARIHRAHLDHHVVVFRDQRITPEQQIAFSRRFGVLQMYRGACIAGKPAPTPNLHLPTTLLASSKRKYAR